MQHTAGENALAWLGVAALKSKLSLFYAGLLLFSLVAIVGAYKLADSYIDRLPDHRGFHLVAVDNQVVAGPLTTPRRTVLVVVDGLRQDMARTMRSTQRLQELGQCRETDTGPLTISRPVYAVISTGLEQDRTGSRNNDDESSIAVESIWDVAHQAGMKVHAASNLMWWRQLFPGAFDSYRFDLDETQNFFIASELSELSLVHPVRVDTAGHSFGAASQQYRDAVVTVDAELMQLLDVLDLNKDLLVLTADHGHSATGGHGGTANEIAKVLTCFAGPTIRPDRGKFSTDSRTIAPTLSVLLGLPFPKHMRAGDDDLDQIWSLVRTDLLGANYIQERKESIAYFREVNARAVGNILGQESGGWSELYTQGTRRHQLWWLSVCALLIGSLVGLGRLRRLSLAQGMQSLAWMLGGLSLACLLYTWVRGSFDFTSINERQEFLDASIGVSLSVSVFAAGVHFACWRNLHRLLLDHSTLLLLLVVVSLAHPLIYGVTLGFPLPGRIAIFLPFILGALVISGGAVGALLATVAWFWRVVIGAGAKAQR